MSPARQIATGDELPPVGFESYGSQRTPDDPCRFLTPEDNRCTPQDALEWQRHAEQWLASLKRRADTPERNAVADRMFDRYAKFVKASAECSAMPWTSNPCTPAVDGFIITARLAREYLLNWGASIPGEIVQDQGRNAVNLPIPGEVREMAEGLPAIEQWWNTIMNRVEAHAKKHWFDQYLPLIFLGTVLFMAGSDIRRRLR